MGPGGGGGRGLKGQCAQPSPHGGPSARSPPPSPPPPLLLPPSGVQGPEPQPRAPRALSHGRLRSLKVRSPGCRCRAASGHHSGPSCLGRVRACVPLPSEAWRGHGQNRRPWTDTSWGPQSPRCTPCPLQHPAWLSLPSSPHPEEGGREQPGTPRAPDHRPKAWATEATPRSSEKRGGMSSDPEALPYPILSQFVGGRMRSPGRPWGSPRPQDHPGPAAP